MKKYIISEITVEDVLNYIRVSPMDADRKEIETLMSVAHEYISSETGQDPDSHPEFVEPYFLLIQHMYDNRTMIIDKDNVNPIVTSILGHHRGNFLS